MHETGVVRSLIHEVERVAKQNVKQGSGEPRVLVVSIRMGALCPFSEEHLREHFIQESAGTVAESACLLIERGEDFTFQQQEGLPALDAHAQDLILMSIELHD